MTDPPKKKVDTLLPSPILIEKCKKPSDSEPSTPVSQPRNLSCPGAPRSSRKRAARSPILTPTQDTSNSELFVSDDDLDGYDLCSIDSESSSQDVSKDCTIPSNSEAEFPLLDKHDSDNEDKSKGTANASENNKKVNESNKSSSQGHICNDRFFNEFIPPFSRQLKALHAYEAIPHHCQPWCRTKCQEFFAEKYGIKPEAIEEIRQLFEKTDKCTSPCEVLYPKPYNYQLGIPLKREIQRGNHFSTPEPLELLVPADCGCLQSLNESRLKLSLSSARIARKKFRTSQLNSFLRNGQVPENFTRLAELDFFTGEEDKNSPDYSKDLWKPPVIEIKQFSKNGVGKTNWKTVLRPRAEDALKEYLAENERLKREKTMSKEDLKKSREERRLEAEKKARDLEKKKKMIEKLDALTEPYFLAKMNARGVIEGYEAMIAFHKANPIGEKSELKNESSEEDKPRMDKDRKGKGVSKQGLVEEKVHIEGKMERKEDVLCNVETNFSEETRVELIVSEKPYGRSQGIRRRVSINISIDK